MPELTTYQIHPHPTNHVASATWSKAKGSLSHGDHERGIHQKRTIARNPAATQKTADLARREMLPIAGSGLRWDQSTAIASP